MAHVVMVINMIKDTNKEKRPSSTILHFSQFVRDFLQWGGGGGD